MLLATSQRETKPINKTKINKTIVSPFFHSSCFPGSHRKWQMPSWIPKSIISSFISTHRTAPLSSNRFKIHSHNSELIYLQLYFQLCPNKPIVLWVITSYPLS